MNSYQERSSTASYIFEKGKRRIKENPPPVGQKFLPGTRVHISDNLGHSMPHFPSGKDAIVVYTYAHAYGGKDIDSYCLNIDGVEISWYHEHQLTEISHN